jgi:fatty-acyl-CoA synthase
MWPHRSLYGTTAATFKGAGEPLPSGPGELGDAARRIHEAGRAPRLLPAAPLMHGTSAISSWGALSAGGCVVTLAGRTLDAVELLDAVERDRVTNLVIVGDAFARPIVTALEQRAARGSSWDLSRLRLIVSSGVMWSEPVKEALLRHVDATLADLVGSSEAVGFANSVAKRGRAAKTARFRLGPDAAVFDEDGRPVEPGSGQVGILAVGGPIPIGYYKDRAKTAQTFREVGGRIWSTPGDYATVEADGTISLLGRGSVCINTAGEKVFPEEVEEVLKAHPDVEDANVVGAPDERWGQAVTAVVAPVTGRELDPSELVEHCRLTLAGYKCPKRIVVVDRVLRGPNGKADYRWASGVVNGG